MAGASRTTVVHLVHSLDGGGTEHTLCRLLEALPRGGLTHLVAVQREPGKAAETLPADVACCPLRADGRDRLVGLRLSRMLRGRRVGVIHARGIGAWTDAMLAAVCMPRVRLLLSFHGLQVGGQLDARHRRRIRWGLRIGARFMSVSASGAGQLRRAGVPASRIEIIPNGVDVNRIRRAARQRRQMRDRLGLTDNDFVLGCVASLTPVKGHEVLLDALAAALSAAPRLKLLIVGDGPLRDSLKQRSCALRIDNRITFTGRREDIPELLSAMDGYVCASHSEGLSNAVLEAMAAGLPVISTDVGDHRDLLNFEPFCLVEPGDVRALASRLAWLAADSDRCKALGRAMLRRAQRHAFAHMTAAYDDLYRRLITDESPESVRHSGR